jgi:hypothetical protein
MPKQSSTTSTSWLALPSVGVSPISFEAHSDLLNWRQHQVEPHNWIYAPEQIFRWSVTDETSDGKVQFETTIDIDVPTLDDISEDAFHRLLSFYIVGRLHGQALTDACQSLTDIYEWQIERARPGQPLPHEVRRQVPKIRRVESTPFAVEED